MKTKIVIDDKSMLNVLSKAKLDKQSMLDISGNGSKIIINKQRQDVPVDTAATKLSINDHITEASDTKVVDEVGPETNYGPYLEYGTGEFAENGKGRKGGWFYVDSKGIGHFTLGMKPRPYVRPSVIGNEQPIVEAISAAFWAFIQSVWYG